MGQRGSRIPLKKLLSPRLQWVWSLLRLHLPAPNFPQTLRKVLETTVLNTGSFTTFEGFLPHQCQLVSVLNISWKILENLTDKVSPIPLVIVAGKDPSSNSPLGHWRDRRVDDSDQSVHWM